jgi:hypothetical protein
MTMRTLFLALGLTLACAGTARAQEPVRTGSLAPAARTEPRVQVPAGFAGRIKAQARAVSGNAKRGPFLRASTPSGAVRRPHAPRSKPAPRG